MPGSLGGSASGSLVKVLDSWPVMEWLKNRQPTANDFLGLLRAAYASEAKLVLSSINLGEIYYNCRNEWSEARAENILADFSALPIQIAHPSRLDVLRAARIKGRYKCSYADGFAAVLALELGAPVLTGDPDFLKLRDGGVIAVEWVGA